MRSSSCPPSPAHRRTRSGRLTGCPGHSRGRSRQGRGVHASVLAPAPRQPAALRPCRAAGQRLASLAVGGSGINGRGSGLVRRCLAAFLVGAVFLAYRLGVLYTFFGAPAVNL
eukprot:2300999-Alexandrium_andersonii.AAC.1